MIRFLFSLLVCSLLACNKKDTVIEEPIPTPIEPAPVPDCSLHQMVVNPEASLATDRDTVFFDKGFIRQATVPGGGLVTYTYQQGKLWKREQYNNIGQLTALSGYEHNVGAGQLIVERKLKPGNPAEVEGFTEFAYGPYGSGSDRIKEISYYNGNRQLQKRFEVVWDASQQYIERISERNSENYPVADYTFTCHVSRGNPLRSPFPVAAHLFVAEPSGYPEAVKIGLLFGLREVARITATTPEFQPLNLAYTFTARNTLKDVNVNGSTAWRFVYACE
jgi:hypothetical protein